MKQGVLIYGCYGYTGELISRYAAERGLQPTLAGRDKQKVEKLAAELKLPSLVFDLTNDATVERSINPFKVVLHCAGPFQYTATPMINACIKTGTHYLDITGEYTVFESAFKRNEEAQKAGVLLMPGVGFDVVPSDCLSLYLKEQLPDAVQLELALAQKGGRISHGTAITVTENLGHSCMVRRNGSLVPVKNGSLLRTITIEGKPRVAVAIPWGDIATAYRSTGIPNITVYNSVPKKVIDGMKLSNYIGFVFRWRWVKNYLIKKIKQRPAGPNETERKNAASFIWGEVKNASGKTYSAVLQLPEGYTITYLTAVRIAELVMQGNAPTGAKTPAQAFGCNFILQFEGVKRTDSV
ncbi:MAG: saccharopine dehydrogenase NADP-binding domain-containing protein [Chitinophagales bacterium]|nr:saccharopine dehydrogenase NADP-binding domain-containing protein [Chitinophagales bacterium]